MHNKKDYLLEVIYKKLKEKSKKINLKKEEFTVFINFLINNN